MENKPSVITVEKAHYLAVLERAVGIRQTDDDDGSDIHLIIGSKLSRIGAHMATAGHDDKKFKEDLLDVELILEYFHLVHS